ncbi:hypothetical protein SAMN05421821_10290 [Mucilaginibacter lappiensis]|uniref:Peptidase A9 domain-containing protein n=1 Tax=Mucilaginibacter lappiensis TaxID=354630 RepID=A0ABR6PI58_9SPHI|nr:hypothetical protein [Mucilaginibacter lappiensis]MBB6108675.1 hypothetical protein [Mucilaginibacter lappiensis]SIQ28272.1 hypothetical protein SAMN05421821_10290 [Mucilaginibacter lappiensis]
MKKDINRAEQLWQNWEEKQQQLVKLMGTSAESTHAIEQEKYDFMRKGLYRLLVQPNEKEKLYLHAITLVTRNLQKKLYPNPVVRLLHRIKARVFDKPAHLRQFDQQKEAGIEFLKHKFKELGLSSYSGKLENYLDYESRTISIPMTTQLADNGTLNIVVKLEKDKTGAYHFEQYKTTIIKIGQPERSHTFDGETTITAQEAVNLLTGRPVLKSYETAEGLIAQKWIQLDFKTNAEAGNFKIKEYHHADGMEKAINEVLPKLGITGLNKKELLNDLQQGHQMIFDAHAPLNEKLYLEANPAEQSILIRDQNRQPVSINTLMERKEEAQKLRAENTLTLVKQREPDKEQSQSLGIG